MRQDPRKRTVVCAMSGGVDSSVAAYLLKEEGHNVVGVTMKLWDCFKTPNRQTCCSTSDADDARRVCEQLKIPHHVMDMREAFKKNIVEYFVGEYSRGRTPNPCIKCNELLKFNLLREEAKRLMGTDVLATGHYARSLNGRLLRGKDIRKDQSYFLFAVAQAQIARTIFPIGELLKEDVRKIADEAGLRTARKRESQEICFVPDNDYAGFIYDYYPRLAGSAGNFVDISGKVLGRHAGIHEYTIGQRRGLGIGVGRRQYVVRINVAKNEVVLGENGNLYGSELTVTGPNWIMDKMTGSFPVQVKIRYRHDPADAMATIMEGGKVHVKFAAPQRAITPGQAAVFYEGEEVVGGGWIE